MLDKNGHELNVGDHVFFDFYDFEISESEITPAVIMEIQPTEIKVMFGVGRWRWVKNIHLEYATTEKMFLYKLEN